MSEQKKYRARFNAFVIPGRDPPKVFEVREETLDAIAHGIQAVIMGPAHFAVTTSRYDRANTPVTHAKDPSLAVISAVGDDEGRRRLWHQRRCHLQQFAATLK